MTKFVETALNDVYDEVKRAKANLPEGFEETNTRNDFIAYINAYIGRAADRVFRNQKEEQDFRSNMVKAAGLAISAIAAFDEGKI